ncbi:hypothetical protein J2TS6_42430 [Paenibacillus albilobatus]|uniref:PcfJ-like protein n=1 Tax=Paenibacillus albilobatus TaxID=2716884 RepID=A0A920CDS6_9BACL|nr:PcfJ domain-containing protein [Paenibacillus albilobatus]GIO33102.1 hypothetical protein J2TS6_42430 [Paenibacillus albilobatus]
MKAEEKEYRAFNRHFSKTISQEIKDYVTDTVLRGSRYIFIHRVARVQFGYCTHCQKKFRTETPLKHNDKTTCPKCKSTCHVRNHGTSRKYLVDDGFFVYYEKSVIDPGKTIIARAFKVSRDYRGDYTKVQTKYIQMAKYLFEAGTPGKAEMYESYYWWTEREKYVKCASVHSLESKSIYANNHCSIQSIKNAVAGTPFQYSTWEQHEQPQCDYVKFFALYSKYPSIEYLTKLGFSYFVNAKLFDKKTFNCINWRGKGINQILRLSTQDIKSIQHLGDRVNPLHLFLFQHSRNDSNRPTIDQILSTFNREVDVSDRLKFILKYVNVGQVISYIRKQINRPENKTYREYTGILTAWRDYLRDCLELNYDLQSDYILFPRDLHQSHQRTMKLVSIKANEVLEQKIQRRVKELNHYTFEYKNLMIRPATSAAELIREGQELKHCVGRYAEDYAKGRTSIFLIRQKNNESQPFYTMEIIGDRIIQTRGYENELATPEVEEFVFQFEKAKLAKKPNRKDVAI